MKHNFLRRLSALILALVMAASLCISPAWADDGDTGDSGNPGGSGDTGDTSGGGTTTDPDYTPQPLTFSSYIIMLEDSSKSYNLVIGGLSRGESVTLTGLNNATVNNVTNTPQKVEITDENVHEITIPVGVASTAGIVRSGQINVVRTDRNGNVGATTYCYVYCGYAPFTYTPSDNVLSVTDKQSISLKVQIDEHPELFTADNVTFKSGDPTYATVVATKSGNNYVATITGVAPLINGTVPITMTFLEGGYQKTWDLQVEKSSGTEYVTFLQLNPNKLTLTAGNTYTFNASDQNQVMIIPDNATNKTLTWESQNSAIATVDKSSGKITAVAAGTTTITATAVGGVSATCEVTVTESASAVTLDPANITLNLDAIGSTQPVTTATLKVVPTGQNSSNVSVAWRSSNASIASVSAATGTSITVTGLKAGSATITATVTFKDLTTNKTTTTKTVTCPVTVLDANSTVITSMTLSETSHSMPADGSFTMSVRSVTPSNAPVKTVTWRSSDPSIIEVDPKTGVVTAKKAGQAAVIARADFGGAESACIVTVTEITDIIRLNFGFDSNYPLGSNNYTYTFKSTGNDYIPVTAVLSPSGTYGAADPIHWASENSSVATVSNTTSTKTVITAVGPGKTTVTAIPMDPAGKDRAVVDPAEITVTVSGVTIVNDSDNAITSLTLMPDRRQTVLAKAWGDAYTGNHSVDWTSSDPSILTVNPKSGESTILTARTPGTVTLTARKGSYMATCTVTVTEDSIGLIDGISTQPSTPYQFSSLASRLQSACSQKTGSTLSYVTNLSVASTDQGVLYDQHHSSDDTGAGVGLQDRYYPGTAPQGQRSLSDLSFVPKNTFNGVAEINYTAWSANNQSFSGVIRINVNGTGDVTYSSSEGSVVTFLSDDFNFYHANLRSVSFTLPLDSRGTLYYGYSSPSQPGTKVTAGTAYYRTGTPSLDRVSFVPASGYKGTVTISYTATDTSGRTTPGTVTINVGGETNISSATDIYYPVAEDSWVTFQPTDFGNASLAALGEQLSYVRFSLPKSSDGTLFYNYRGFGNYDSDVASTTSYYYGGTPSLGSVSFVPTTTTPGQVDITYTGYTVRGNTFTGTIHIGQSDPNQQQGGLRYTVFTGKSVYFNATDFNTACIAATGASLNYVLFSPLPAVGEGTLRYTRGSSSTIYSLATTTRCYRTSSNTSDILLGSVSFLANNSFTGTVTIPFTGYNTNGVSFTGEVVVTVTPPTSGDSVYYGTTASPLALSSSRIRSACSDVLDGTLSYITFSSLPSSSAGRLYLNYSQFGTGTEVNTGTQYYVSGSPSIDQISFVPRGRYTGQVSVAYTATNTNGKSVTGLITFNLTSTANSTYFSDMAYHTWAGPAVDYLYRNGVTNGVTATTYGPDQHILRCDFVLMLCRAFHFTGGSGYSFADVPTDAYFADAVATAKKLGIVNGDGVNFMPYDELTRQDAMVIFKNALDAAGWNVSSASTTVLGNFPDGVSVASYARSAVSTLVQLGAVTGDNGMLYPYNPITRAEAAVILHFVMTM